MTNSFRPPGIKSLAELDGLEAPYQHTTVWIQGVVAPSAQFASVGDESTYRIHLFFLGVWRKTDGPLQRRTLTILRPMPNDDVDFLDDVPWCDIVRLKVLLSADETRAVVDETGDTALPDPELEACADELRNPPQPPTISTLDFGDLVLNEQSTFFQGELEWCGATIEIWFPETDGRISDVALATARGLCSEQEKWKDRVEAYIVDELLPIKNSGWLGEDEAPLTPFQFIERMKLGMIVFHESGVFEFSYYDDGSLFTDHSIEVYGDLTSGLTAANIEG